MVWMKRSNTVAPEEEQPCLLHEHHSYYGAVSDEEAHDVEVPGGWGARHTMAVLACLGFFVTYAARVNISMAIVAMVNATAIELLNTSPGLSAEEDFCPGNRTWQLGSEPTQDGPFVWSAMSQGVILSSYFVGYTLTQVPGGRLAERVGATRTLTVGVGLTGVLTLLAPLSALWGAGGLIANRILVGLASGVAAPSIHCLLARWVPPSERSRISTFVYIGKQLGTATTILAAGPLSQWEWAGGWQGIFYVTGALSLLWTAAWTLLVYETPALHPSISFRERVYIYTLTTQSGDDAATSTFPWRQALTSRPFQALILVHFCQNWGDYLIMTELPTYISTALKYPLDTNAMFSALPQLVKVFVALSLAYIADWLVASGHLRVNVNRKMWNSIGLYLPAVFLVGVSYAGCNDAAVLTLMVLIVGFNGAVLSGYNINHMDLAPNFAGTLMGITNGVATLAGVFAPFQAGYVINQSPSLSNWRTVFLTAAGMFALGNTVFLVFGSTELQYWNDPLVSPCLEVEEHQDELKRQSAL